MKLPFINFYHKLRPIFFLVDPEKIHKKVISGVQKLSNSPIFFRFLDSQFNQEYNVLGTDIFEMTLKNPVGLAAGFDKDGKIIKALFGIGFGFIEIGTVTLQPQLGNKKPRLFRLVEDEALINSLGFNNLGAFQMSENLKKSKNRIEISNSKENEHNLSYGMLGINIGKNSSTPIENASEDYVNLLETLYPYGDYFTLNISSPNTESLVNLQKGDALKNLLKQVCNCRDKLDKKFSLKTPILIKISPDLNNNELDEIILTAKNFSIQGIIATNTSNEISKLFFKGKTKKGGLSGKPLQNRSTMVIRKLFKELDSNTKIIGAGGIFNGEDAYEKIRAGASVIQIYTSLIYEGPAIVKKIKKELAILIKRDGFKKISEVVGIDN